MDCAITRFVLAYDEADADITTIIADIRLYSINSFLVIYT
jgi:hypothetical protein